MTVHSRSSEPATPRHVNRWHLAWGLTIGLFVELVVFVVAFYPWCGTEQCSVLDPGRYKVETIAALTVTVVGAGLVGTVAFLAPWTRSRLLRLGVATVVAAIPLALAVWYVPTFTVG